MNFLFSEKQAATLDELGDAVFLCNGDRIPQILTPTEAAHKTEPAGHDAMTTEWRVVPYDGLDGLLRLAADWHRLTAAMPDRGFHHLYETHVAYVQRMARAHGPMVFLALHDGGRVRAICPLEPQRHTILGRRQRAWGLAAGLGDVPRDVICPADDEARRELLPRVVGLLQGARDYRGWLVFERILETSVVWQCLHTLNPATFCTDVVGATAYISSDKPFKTVMAGLARNFRQNLRTQRNRLAAHTNVHLERAADPRSVAAAFEQFLEVEASGWKGTSGEKSALILKPGPLAWHREMIETLHGDERCEIDTLHADGRCIGAQFCLRNGAEYAVLKTGYDEQYSRVAPGHLLLEEALRRSCEDPQIERLNMVGDAAWLTVWRPTMVPTQAVYVALGRSAPIWTSALRLRFRYGPRIKRFLLRARAAVQAIRRARSSAATAPPPAKGR